jgi:multidrug efflux pump subunit AcrA (membrane-fusion protein)
MKSQKDKAQKPLFKRPLFIAGVLIIFLIAGGFGWSRYNRLATFKREQSKRMVKVVRRDVRRDLLLTGKVLPSSSIAVYSPVSGQLKQVLVQEGQRVKEGQTLFAVLQDTSGQRELEARQGEVEKARIELLAARENLDRRRDVRDLFSQAENEKAENDYDRAKVAYDNARQQLSLLENALGLKSNKHENATTRKTSSGARTSVIYVKAPKEGVVTFLNKAVGESVMATTESAEATGREVMILSDTERMMIRSRILEADLAVVKSGQSVAIKLDAFPEKSYRGIVNRISQQGVEDKSGGFTYFVTDMLIEKPDADVRAQMNATVELIVAERKDVLALPANAIATLSGHSVVELPRATPDAPSVYKAVKTGISTDLWVELADQQLSAGDQVLEIDFAKLDLKKLAEGSLGESAHPRDSAHEKP